MAVVCVNCQREYTPTAGALCRQCLEQLVSSANPSLVAPVFAIDATNPYAASAVVLFRHYVAKVYPVASLSALDALAERIRRWQADNPNLIENRPPQPEAP